MKVHRIVGPAIDKLRRGEMVDMLVVLSSAWKILAPFAKKGGGVANTRRLLLLYNTIHPGARMKTTTVVGSGVLPFLAHPTLRNVRTALMAARRQVWRKRKRSQLNRL